MTELRRDLPPLPERMHWLPVDHRGFPVPWFVAFIDGEPDFRCIRRGGLTIALNRKICWLCGQPLGRNLAFVIGPMCAVNRVNSEPPSHRECAEFAARACPFLTKPRMRRNAVDLPEHNEAAGVHIDRNPGATCLWMTRSFKPFRVDPSAGGNAGILLELGPPESVAWYAEGRAATRAEVQASINSGLPFLQAAAEAEGAESIRDLANNVARAMTLLPTT